MVRWHPQTSQLFSLNEKYRWTVTNIDAANPPSELNDYGWSTKIAVDGFQCYDLQFLNDQQKATTSDPMNLVLLSRSNSQSRIDFIPLNPTATQLLEPIISNIPLETIATAPEEAILATGDSNGTLSIWYAAPSLDREPRELFTLPGHRGSAISQLSFSMDGACILSSDRSKRAIQWNSLRHTHSNNSFHEKIEDNKQ
jgi:WD40 repeat protein